jgi:hypothetical protein
MRKKNYLYKTANDFIEKEFGIFKLLIKNINKIIRIKTKIR